MHDFYVNLLGGMAIGAVTILYMTKVTANVTPLKKRMRLIAGIGFPLILVMMVIMQISVYFLKAWWLKYV
jgi:formate/nitrite transporter FocA (FNT family)